MSLSTSEYYLATRHPWASVLFVMPLLVAYEVGVVLLGEQQSVFLRNGADTWLHWLLTGVGLRQAFWPGVFLAIALVIWSWWSRKDRPNDLPNVWLGMAVESLIFAVGLWCVSLSLEPFLDTIGVTLDTNSQPEPALQDLISFLGAGIYEEALFRLLLFSLFCWLFWIGDLPRFGGIILATAISSLVFAAAHHIGPAGETFDGYIFLFRTIAGVYFAVIYQLRGFGVAVGAHAAYDVLVGILLLNHSIG